MPNLPQQVQPGDLITSELFTTILTTLQDLLRRVADLERGEQPGGKVEIISPRPGELFRIGEELRIVGRGFGDPDANVVFIDTNVQVTDFETGSNDQLLIIRSIPFVQNIPSSGRPVTLTVSTPRGFATTSFTLAQPIQRLPTGDLSVTRTGSPQLPPGRNLEEGQAYVFTYTITAGTTLDEVYTLTPRVNLGWRARVVDSNDNPIVPQEIFIAKPFTPTVPRTETVRVEVQIPDPTPDGTTGQLSLTVTSKRNPGQLFRASDDSPLTVAAPPPPADAIGIRLDAVFGGENRSGVLVAPAPAAGAETSVFATFIARVPQAGLYSIAAPVIRNDPNNRWTATVTGATSGIAMQPPESSFSLTVTGRGNAPVARLVVKVTSDSDQNIVGDEEIEIRLG